MPANAIEAIAGRLLAASGLTALIDSRAYPSKPTSNAALPYVVFFRQSGGDGLTLMATRNLRQHEIRVEAIAETQAEAESVLAAVTARLHGWQDRPNGIQGCFAQGDADERTDGDGIQVSGQTYSLWFAPQ
jgi:hypothetical protein